MLLQKLAKHTMLTLTLLLKFAKNTACGDQQRGFCRLMMTTRTQLEHSEMDECMIYNHAGDSTQHPSRNFGCHNNDRTCFFFFSSVSMMGHYWYWFV